MTIMRCRNRVRMTSVSTGTGNITLGSAVAGCQSLATASYATGDTFPYEIVAVNDNGVPTGEWEAGYGTYTSSGTVLVRTYPIDGSDGPLTLTNFTTGKLRVAIGLLAEHAEQIVLDNHFLNPEFQIDQINAGASVALAALSGVTNYIVDGWACWPTSITNMASTGQQKTSAVAGFKNSLRFGRNNGQTGTSTLNCAQVLLSEDCYGFAGQRPVVSFWAAAGANFSGGTLAAVLYYGTGQNQTLASLGAGTWTGQTTHVSRAVGPTTTSQRFVMIGEPLPSTVTQLGIKFSYACTGTAGANDWVELDGIKLERGIMPSPYEHTAYDREFAKCMRRWQQSAGNEYYGDPITGFLNDSRGAVTFAVPMRVAPTVVLFDEVAASGCVSQPGTANGIAATAARIGTSGFNQVTRNSGNFTAGVVVHGTFTADARI